jgi:hypothetical protein
MMIKQLIAILLSQVLIVQPVLAEPPLHREGIALKELSGTPANPASGSKKVYAKDDGKLYTLDSSGNETEVGSGAGGSGSGAYNILENPGFETGTTDGYSESGGGTLAVSSTNPLFDTYSMTYDASANTDYVESDAVTIPDGLKGQNCGAFIYYSGGDSTLTYAVYDGSGNSLASVALAAATASTRASLNFICPSSGSLKYRITASANAASIKVDQGHLGLADNLSEVSQAQIFGTWYMTPNTNCDFQRTTASFGNYSADSDCNTPTVTGAATTTAGKIPGVQFNNVPPGKYKVTAQFTAQKLGVVDASIQFRLTDGTTTTMPALLYDGSDASNGHIWTVSGIYEYTTPQSSITWQVQANSGNASNTARIPNNTSDSLAISIIVEKFPSSTEIAYRADVQNWRIHATLGGGNQGLGTADVATYAAVQAGSLTLTQRTGSASVGIACATGTTSVVGGTTCAASEQTGIVFVPVRAGWHKICTGFSHYVDVGAGGDTGYVKASFKLVETEEASYTTQGFGSGVNKSSDAHYQMAADDRVQTSRPHVLCDYFNFENNSDTRTIRLFYETDTAGTVNLNEIDASQSASYGEPEIWFTVEPVTGNVPMPVLVGGVNTPSTGAEQIVRISYGGATDNSNCTGVGACTIHRSNTSGATVTYAGSGQYSIAFPAGTFSAVPTCTFSGSNIGTRTAFCGPSSSVFAPTTTAFQFSCGDSAGSAATRGEIICMGPK